MNCFVFWLGVILGRSEWEFEISGDGVCFEGLNCDVEKLVRFCLGLRDLEERLMLYFGVGELFVV